MDGAAGGPEVKPPLQEKLAGTVRALSWHPRKRSGKAPGGSPEKRRTCRGISPETLRRKAEDLPGKDVFNSADRLPKAACGGPVF
jgi:hypothetical protein